MADGKRLIRLLRAAVFAIVAVPTVVISGGGAVFADLQPELALRFSPANARANAHEAVAASLLTADTNSSASTMSDRATSFARAALSRDPTLAFAWRTLALDAAGRSDEKGTAALFAVSERLSRRDLGTRLWLLEREVERGNVAGALFNYDIALRTAPSSYETLMPILVAAAGDANVVPLLGQRLAQQPPWAVYFYYRLSIAPPDADRVAELLEEARVGGPIPNRDMASVLLPTLVERGAYGAALRTAAVFGAPRARLPKGLWSPGFEGDGLLAPLDWALTTNDTLGAETRSTGSSASMVASVVGEVTGTVARQLLILPAGRYRYQATLRATDRPAASVTARVACVRANADAALASQTTVPSVAGVLQSIEFVVPESCRAQWLSLDVVASDAEGGEVEVSRLSLQSIAARRGHGGASPL